MAERLTHHIRGLDPEHGIELESEPLHAVQLLDRLIQEGRLKPERPFNK